MINPLIFLNKATKSAYAYEPKWNDKFSVCKIIKFILFFIGLQQLDKKSKGY